MHKPFTLTWQQTFLALNWILKTIFSITLIYLIQVVDIGLYFTGILEQNQGKTKRKCAGLLIFTLLNDLGILYSIIVY